MGAVPIVGDCMAARAPMRNRLGRLKMASEGRISLFATAWFPYLQSYQSKDFLKYHVKLGCFTILLAIYKSKLLKISTILLQSIREDHKQIITPISCALALSRFSH